VVYHPLFDLSILPADRWIAKSAASFLNGFFPTGFKNSAFIIHNATT
jgi:hypothetical protein